MSEKKNILQRINQVRKAIGYVQKDKSVSTGSGSYKAVTHDQVTAMVRGHMIEAGIVCVPNLVASRLIEGETKSDGKKGHHRYEATYSFDFCNEDDAADKVSIVIEAHAMDNADKAPGKAISYAKKYALLKLFEIETGESEESRYQSEEFDIELHKSLILACDSMDALKKQYASSLRAAEEARDRQACKDVIATKDARKAQLEVKK